MARIHDRIFLYSGLGLLLFALIIRGIGGGVFVWLPVFCVAILLKIIFLVLSLRKNKLKFHLWLKLILAGVVLIFVSLFFKYIYPAVLLRNIFFYLAIALKASGLVVMAVSKFRKK